MYWSPLGLLKKQACKTEEGVPRVLYPLICFLFYCSKPQPVPFYNALSPNKEGDILPIVRNKAIMSISMYHSRLCAARRVAT
jgi:hypothetical protein